jgi:phosphoribosylamine-glycine ligase
VVADIVQRTVRALAQEGTPYVGVLFAGLMLTESGPQLLEYNCRMGDPETQVVLPLLRSPGLYEIMHACTRGTLGDLTVEWSTDSAATVSKNSARSTDTKARKRPHQRPDQTTPGVLQVVMAAKGYPGSYPKGLPISGLEGESKRLFVESPWSSLPANASGFDTHRDSITSRCDCSGGGGERGLGRGHDHRLPCRHRRRGRGGRCEQR